MSVVSLSFTDATMPWPREQCCLLGERPAVVRHSGSLVEFGTQLCFSRLKSTSTASDFLDVTFVAGRESKVMEGL